MPPPPPVRPSTHAVRYAARSMLCAMLCCALGERERRRTAEPSRTRKTTMPPLLRVVRKFQIGTGQTLGALIGVGTGGWPPQNRVSNEIALFIVRHVFIGIKATVWIGGGESEAPLRHRTRYLFSAIRCSVFRMDINYSCARRLGKVTNTHTHTQSHAHTFAAIQNGGTEVLCYGVLCLVTHALRARARSRVKKGVSSVHAVYAMVGHPKSAA